MSSQAATELKYIRKCRLPECGIEFTTVYPLQKFHSTVCTQIFHNIATVAKKRASRAAAPKTPHTLKVAENLNHEGNNAFNSKWLSKPLAARP